MLDALVLTLACLVPSEPPPHPFGVADMLAMQRIAEAQLAPDGKWIAFTLRTTDVEANRGRTDVWLAGVDGKTTRRLTTHPDNDWAPVWSPDGRGVYFLSTRSGSAQVWRIDMAGGEAAQVTHFPLDVNTALPVGDGRMILTFDVYPDAATLEETAKRDEAKAASKVKAMAFDELLFRHWDDWEDGKRSHVFVWTVPAGGGDGGEAAAPRDLMKGMAMDAPEHPFGGAEEIAVAPDGKTVAFVGRNAGRDAAWSTNLDVWLAPTDGAAAPVALTAANLGADMTPAFSPDGKTLAVLSQARAGYESDRARIVLYDLAGKTSRVLTEGWDRSASELAWTADGKGLVTSADHLGAHAIFYIDTKTGAASLVSGKGTNGGVQVGRDVVVFGHDDLRSPVELVAVDVKHLRDGKEASVRPVTRVNATRVAAIAWPKYEQFTFEGAKGDKVSGYVVWPSGHVEGQKAPVAMLIHGGPQGSMGDHFHYRWNPMAYAGHGYAVVFIDFHGSTGYGQAFTDAIRGDWGGAPFEDLMKGMDYVLAHYPFMDATRTVALGASYGGFMINWINGHTNRFKALVCHDGNLDEMMAYFDTEELWFPEWEHRGTPWENPGAYNDQSPLAFVGKWQTPTLVVHGGKDFRVVDTQGMGTFTALQRRGIPSRFLYFPDENHWVLKPQNSQRWHAEVLAWLDRWTK